VIHLGRVRAIAYREWLDVRRSRGRWRAGIVGPLLLFVLLLMVTSMPRESHANLPFTVFVLFLMMSTSFPTIVAAHSFVGEKEARTLEPLLATPVATAEIVLGKLFVYVMTGIVPTYGFYFSYLAACRVFFAPGTFELVTALDAMLPVLAISPPLTVLAICVGMRISMRSVDSQSAQSWASLSTLPTTAVFVALVAILNPSGLGALLLAVVLLIIDAVAVWIVTRSLDRHEILTRWG
jgi:ABC-2 type transport system permease protein